MRVARDPWQTENAPAVRVVPATMLNEPKVTASLRRTAVARRYLEMAEDERTKGNLKDGIEYLTRAIHTMGTRGKPKEAVECLDPKHGHVRTCPSCGGVVE